ncbi:MAG: hypothetical protein IID46_10590 [Planctomycetes bacterium]|nr:hypothetical protein [Planctomycetota bacterium]
MNRFLPLVLVLMISAVCVAPAEAQKKSAPEVNIVLKSGDELLSDLKFILSLTEKESQKQWDVIKAILDEIYLIDINKKKPIRIDVISEGNATYIRSAFPVSNLNKFRKNTLEPFGIDTRAVRNKRQNNNKKKGPVTLYRCGNLFDGYLRYLHNYAVLGEKLLHIPRNFPDPTKSIAGLVEKFDLGMRFKNADKGLDDRKKWFDEKRQELLAAVKSKDGESTDDYDLRKLIYEQQLEEFGRFYVEASEGTIGWNTDVQKEEGRLEFDISAIGETSLEKSFDLLGQQPSYFANIPSSAESIFSGRFNLPLDDLRKENLLEFAKIMKTRAEKNVDADDGRNAEQKENSKKVVGLLYDLITKNAKAGLFDGFIEIRLNQSGNKTTVGGFRTEEGTVLVDLLKLISESKTGRNATLDVDKEGEISIHKLSIPAKDHELLAYFIEDDTAYIGTSKESVWFAAGEDALEELKAAIQKVALPNTGNATDPFVNVSINLKPWIEQRDKRRGEEGDVKLRQRALKAFKPGEDKLTFEMKRVEKNITGTLTVQQGILRLVGEMMATFSKETF